MAAILLTELPVKEFLDRLASGAPTPGGGSAAALTGALAAALGRMVCNLTVGRPKFADREAAVRQLCGRLTRAAAMLQQLVDEDAAAYEELTAALKLEKSNPGRREQIEQAATLAAAVPLETLTIAQQVLHDLRRLEPISNPALRPDVFAAQHLARASLHAAEENIRANLPLLPGGERERVEAELAAIRCA